MNNKLLFVGEDTFFQSPTDYSTIQVHSTEEALALVDRFDFEAIIARDGSEILKAVREQGKHTPFLNLTHLEAVSDCCGGHLSPEATLSEKAEMLGSLLERNHQTDCR